MICFFPVHQGDAYTLKNLLIWIRQLGGCAGHKAVIVADAGMTSYSVFDLKQKAEQSFGDVTIITNQTSVKGWIHGSNSLFLEAAKCAHTQSEPWLFLEPDAVPLKRRWLDSIEIQYRTSGATFMGALVKCDKQGLPPIHMPGVSVYPPSAYRQLANTINNNPNTAFDISIAGITAPIATKSELFQHLWGEFNNPPTFAVKAVPGTNTFSLGFLKPNAVLFHRTKDGKLIDLLRESIGIPRKTFIQLGRTGDIILSLPELHWIFEHDGIKPRYVTSDEFVSVLEGVSYVEPAPVHLHWWNDLNKAINYCKTHYGETVVLQCHGANYGVDYSQPTFMHATHFRSGVPMELFMEIPLVFDMRNRERENKYLIQSNGKPYVMINTRGFSSPFPYEKQLYASLMHLAHKIHIVNMAYLKVPRIFDLLGLYDRALGTIHVDTATLHLAHGSPTPYIGFSRGGWSSSTPRGNCVLNMDYAHYPARAKEVVKTVESWIP